MKHSLALILLLLILFSCKKTEQVPGENTGPPISLDSLSTLATNLPTARYSDLVFTNKNTGYAITKGLIVKTTDGGINWTQQPALIDIPLKKIQFTDSQTGFIIGGNSSGGYLLRTGNAGQSWDTVRLNTPDCPNGMYFINNTTGFITGSNLFSKTTDGGLHWTNIKSNPFRIFYDIKFKNKSEGIVTSSSGAYFKTNNGGISWDSIQTPYTINLGYVYFTETKTLLTTSADTLIDIKSNYNIIKKSPNAYQLLFLNSEKCIGIGNHYEQQGFWPYGDIFITNNNWVDFKQKTFSIADAIDFTAIAKMSEDKIMIIGLGFSGTKVLLLKR